MKKNNDKKILKDLNSIFINVFDDETIQIDPKTTASDISNWDSLNHIRLVLEIESKYNIKFNSSEIENTKSVEEFVKIIKKLDEK